MLTIMFTSCYQVLARPIFDARTPQEEILIRLALPQLILAMFTFTTFHVQIITRISSGYPLVYIWMASKLVGDELGNSKGVSKESNDYSQLMIRWMLVYAIVQGGLFASFLPPA